MVRTGTRIRIGVAYTTLILPYTGLMGEGVIYNNRLPSLLEVQHLYLATKWRYA